MKKPDWEAIKREYCAGQLSIRALAEKYGVSDTAIRKRAKAGEWPKPEKVRKTGSHNSGANLRTKDKKSISKIENIELPEIENQIEESRSIASRYGLNDMQAKFVSEYLIDLDKTAAYKRAGYKCEGLTGAAAARRLYRHVSVNKAIRDALEAREKRTHITQDAVLNWWWDIATANANEISEFRRLCCRHCWGIENKYQWINEQEYQEESEKRTNNGKPAPLDDGGYGFDSTLDPNPDCPRCNGEGQGRAHFHDSRDLSVSARRLYAGVKQGKFGLEVITRNQDDALKMVGQHLGMLKNKTEISGPDGGAINQVNYTPEDYSKAQQMLEGKLPGLD
ncbi:TPA: terminase small subunit [Yersinia enterocolitica]|uniref:terminase small subunit n=1 Tax=Yersinia enterocolitica TaxID=630 RepID=UPI0005E05DC6|nr:terminase small subunit [Yersinia enterocolitica]CQH11333.1 Terminase small subunit [Yersinia enterocolitica]HDL7687507.1 terminase small subunit [Yersinia enterocolitica]HDL7789120.1 terminase small subunit [Yersinia enterocolitica]HDL8193883.1 terminase small subunit [Yersinia enterocolitica]HDM9014508.1 terminase small subunit [Yersinia enterocolitica]